MSARCKANWDGQTSPPIPPRKGAVKMLTKGMAIDWGKYGIKRQRLGPGLFQD